MSGYCRVCGETICVCDEKIETISEKIETINEEKRMSIEAMKQALKALQNTATHPLTGAEQYEAEMDAMEALDDAIDDQREWFGLTDEEVEQVFPAIATYHAANKTLYRSIARAIEAKLKEKNNG